MNQPVSSWSQFLSAACLQSVLSWLCWGEPAALTKVTHPLSTKRLHWCNIDYLNRAQHITIYIRGSKSSEQNKKIVLTIKQLINSKKCTAQWSKSTPSQNFGPIPFLILLSGTPLNSLVWVDLVRLILLLEEHTLNCFQTVKQIVKQ